MTTHTFCNFESKFPSTAFQVSAVGLGEKSYVDSLEECEHTKLSHGIYENISFPVVFKHEYGRKLCDIIDTGWVDLFLISDKLRDLLTEHNLSGWQTFPVKIYDEKDNEISGYHGFSVFGRSGMIDYSKCTVREERPTPTDWAFKYYKGATINPEEWDGSDFFHPRDSYHILTTEKVYKVLKKSKLSNVRFRKLENLEIECDMNKIDCSFGVVTGDADVQIVTKELSLEPTRFYNKGDKVISKSSSGKVHLHGLWEIQAETIISEYTRSISHQIKYFQELFKDKMGAINKLKNQYQFECSFTMSIETEDIGSGFDFSEEELSFITAISSRYSCFFIVKESIIPK